LACRRAAKAPGFSLFELMIVLAILSLMGVLAMPSLLKIADRTSFSLNRQDVERQLDALPQIAASLGRNVVLTSSPTAESAYLDDASPSDADTDAYPVKLPSGWTLTVDAPIRYRYDGTCSGGRLHVAVGSFEADYRMNPPLCELRPG
jgi:prepilin-type N-terminal cleavage/methylation domain-containing protein